MVPSSADIADPTRPASIVAASTGPSSLTSEMLMTEPSRVANPIMANWLCACTGSTMPMTVPVIPTTGTLDTPIEYRFGTITDQVGSFRHIQENVSSEK